MPEFNFQGRNENGQAISGKRESSSMDSLVSQLHSEGIIPITITPTKSGTSLAKTELWPKKVKNEDMLIFCRQMYTLIKAGIPIIYALTRMSEMVINPSLKRALQTMGQNISSGQTLSSSMQHFPKIFSNVLVQLVHVGEESGQLEKTFLQAAEYMELQTSTRRRIKTVLRYPIFVLTAISVAVVILNIFVIPAFARLYGSFKVKLPLPTRILLNISNFMRQDWWLLLGIIFLIFFGTRYYLKTNTGKLWWGRFQFRIPIFGPILEHILLMRFAKIFATILRAGVPLLEALRLVASAVDNAYARQTILSMSEAIEHGENLTQAASHVSFFTPIVLQMISVGEESGTLDTMLDEVGGFYEREVDYEIKKLADRIEPLIIVAIAGMVLVLALGVFLPMWDLAKLARGGG